MRFSSGSYPKPSETRRSAASESCELGESPRQIGGAGWDGCRGSMTSCSQREPDGIKREDRKVAKKTRNWFIGIASCRTESPCVCSWRADGKWRIAEAEATPRQGWDWGLNRGRDGLLLYPCRPFGFALDFCRLNAAARHGHRPLCREQLPLPFVSPLV